MRTLLFAALFLLLPQAAPAQFVEGTVHWRGSVQMTEKVRVSPGATLIVEPGTTVHFAPGGGLEVAGRLQASAARFTGRNWEGIVLKGTDAETRLTDCSIDGATTGILVVGGTPHLERLTLTGNQTGLELRQKSAAAVVDCLIRNNVKVGLFVKDGATPAVSGCRIEKNGKFGAYLYRSTPQQFSANRFRENPTGLMVSHFGSDPLIRGNVFEQNETGIFVDRAARPELVANLLHSNSTAIRLSRRADPRITGNRLADNRVGIAVAFSSYPRIAGNDFTGNETALLLEFQSATWEKEQGEAARAAESAQGAFGQAPRQTVSEADRRPQQLRAAVDARHNWWGEAGTRELAGLGPKGNPSFIRDGRDTPTFEEGGKPYPLDVALFAPWSPSPLTEETMP